MKTKILEISVFAALLICIISSVSFSKECDNIRGSLLRLHVIASGDTEEEQALKLKVRDAILEDGADIFMQNDSLDSAAEKVSENLERLTESAEKTIRENGYTYGVSVELTKCYFPTRVYENITLPAGKYNAVRVIIGDGKGKNWWCVMFPPMCLPAAKENEAQLNDILGEKSMDIVSNSRKYEIRFWIVEKWEEFLEKAEKRKP